MPPKIDLSALPPLDQIKGASIGSWNKTQLLAVAIGLEIPMTDINYDFCVHVLMLLYKELVEGKPVKGQHGGYRPGSGRKKKDPEKAQVLGRHRVGDSSRRRIRATSPSINSTAPPAAFFLPRNTNQPAPRGDSTTMFAQVPGLSTSSMWSGIGVSHPAACTASGDAPNNNNVSGVPSVPGISVDRFMQLNAELEYIAENDEFADIAAGDKFIDESLVNASDDADTPEPEPEILSSDAGEEAALHKYLLAAAFPAYISARGAISKLMMWQMSNTFATRFGPAPFSELVSEIQHRFHADSELMYMAAANFYGQRDVAQFSAFDDPKGYAGSPPSVKYLKGLFTDYVTAHRIYIERDIASLPLGIAKADHTFDFLRYMGDMKGERVFNAAYTVLNEDECVRAHSLTQTKSLQFVKDMFEGIQEGLKKSNHPPTQVLYTDSPQSERSFHESINSALAKDVVPVTDWTDLPLLSRPRDIPSAVFSDSIAIEEIANDILKDAASVISSSMLYVVVLAIKGDYSPGQPARLNFIQLRTRDKIYILKVTALTMRSHILPSLHAILTNPSIIKAGHSIRQTLQRISEVFSLPEIDTMLKIKNSPILDLGNTQD
ncbi:hypothetical protein C8R43DRAFT_1118980 [Mycena crocata]|nr:hypothetical protein C8R43DRAFT_1118980 [Mycena crocata]